ncbi:hypothetical protein PUV54_04050 [Hyphococcus flavus]|uniref:Uncharacterized protein n=1 Tax=Hyphococcus flavus TaxID=1866326 RepID=A0AAE9ZCK7_9PROT|nr:hypothetical protein [Hyphococcus flavus]WDI32364.1 hypothetical protein PUV54_04050 [Hyphococcus flavus]
MTEIIIDKRFCGPKTSANGGYAAGLFAQVINGPAEVMLKSPPPLDAPITLKDIGDDNFHALHGENLVAVIRPANVIVSPPTLPDDDGVQHAHDRYLDDAGGEHMLPYCFVCGNKRKAGDGLRIFSGPAPDSPVNADFWTLAKDLAGSDGLVRPEFLWAALDCPSAFSLRLWPRLSLLGRLAADIRRRPKPGERLIVAAWPEKSEGRKHFASTVLLDANRDIIAAANAVWIELNDPEMLEKLRAENR